MRRSADEEQDGRHAADQQACPARGVVHPSDHTVSVSGVDVGWSVMESGEDGRRTGRPLSGLHEDLLTMEPSGRDGADMWR